MTTETQERAGIWQRVSTGGQDEASQLPDILRYCADHGYAPVEPYYTVHGKSAFHGRQAADLDRAFNDMTAGKFTVLVVWAADRIERRGALASLMLAKRAQDAGGRIEYVKDSHLNVASEMNGTMLALAGDMAQMESKRKSDRVKIKQDALRAAGSAVGRAPWGYSIVTRDGKKIYAPTEAGRNYVPLIFQMIIDGSSCRDVAAWLTDEKVPTWTGNAVWNEAYIGNRLIKNTVYYGQRVNGGTLVTEGLVTWSQWSAANAALSARVRPGRATVVQAKPLFSPVCGNPDCDATGAKPSPMYRVMAGGQSNRTPYFRCTGRGPQRKGCGNMVPLEATVDRLVSTMSRDTTDMHVDRVFIAGDDRSDEVGRLREAAMTAYRRGDKKRFSELDMQADALDALPAVRPHWQDIETDQNEGAYFRNLDNDGIRDYLAARFTVSAHKSGDDIVISVGARDAL